MISDKKNKYTNFENIFPYFMETVDDLIIIVSPNNSFKIEYIHKCEFLEQLGYSDESLIGKSLLNLIDFGDNASKTDLLKRIQQNKNKQEVKVINNNGKLTWAELISTIFSDEKNQQKLIVRLRDISKTRESENKFRTITEQSFMGIIILQDGVFKYFNEQARKLNGYSEEEIRSWKPYEFTKLIHPEDRVFVSEQAKKKESGDQNIVKHHKYRLITKTGDVRWIENYSKSIIFKGRAADLIMSVDITDNINADQKLKESEEKYRLINENANDLMIIIDNNFNNSFFNDAYLSLGYSWDEILNLKPANFIHPNDINRAIETFKECLKTGTGLGELRFKYADGHYSWFIVKGKTFKDKDGDLKLLLISRDITERKKTKRKIQESESKYRSLFENMNAGFAYHKVIVNDNNDPIDYKYLEVNPAFEKLTGLKKEDLIGKNVTEAIPGTENDPADWIGKYGKVGITGIPLTVENYSEAIDKWFKVSGYSPKKGFFAVTFNDITDRKKAEAKLIASEEKYRRLFENSPIALMIQDYSEMKIYVDHLKASGINDFEKYFNDKPNEVLKFITKVKVIDVNRKTLEVYKANSKEEFILRMNQLGESIDNIGTEEAFLDNKMEMLSLINGNTMYESEIVTKTFTGETIYLYAKTSIVPEFESTWSKVIVSIVDITDRKLTEQKLKESEERYHKLFETSPDGVILTDLKGNIIECNSAIELISGYSPREFIGKNFIKLDIYHENGLEKLLEGYRDLLEDNQINWVQVRSTLINMKDQAYILAVIHDVTTQKEAEEAIKRSEERYRDILETSSVGVIEIDVIKNQIKFINPKLVEIIGYRGDELTEDHFFNKLIHPKDLRKLLDSNEESELEFRIFDKSGKLKWLTGKKIPRFNENGQVISIRVWLEDITEKKMYENLIYELNVNFLNFTTDIKNNIQLLLNTCLNLLNGDFILYINKTAHEGQETYQILTSDNKSFMCDAEFFADNLFVSALFYESHDFPQTFLNINKMSFANTDPFIARYNLNGCFGKLIKSQNDLESAVCVFYKENPAISNQDKLVMFLICDAIEIEQRRWHVQRGLEEQNITLNKINKLKSELFSRTSHELKTPLISIKGFTELLLTLHKPKLDNDVISILNEIKEGSKRLEKIINLLLESTKLEAGQLELSLSKEDLSFLINFCVNELKGLVKLRNQSIDLKLHDTLETKFDKERIYEVISNLLVNAIKYTPPGGNITIESTIKNGFYLISVKDNGIGFTAEEKNQVFQQFGKIERYGQGWDVAIEGTGLGLYITKKLVELHEGKIWLESEGRNKGSTFNFTIPIKKN